MCNLRKSLHGNDLRKFQKEGGAKSGALENLPTELRSSSRLGSIYQMRVKFVSWQFYLRNQTVIWGDGACPMPCARPCVTTLVNPGNESPSGAFVPRRPTSLADHYDDASVGLLINFQRSIALSLCAVGELCQCWLAFSSGHRHSGRVITCFLGEISSRFCVAKGVGPTSAREKRG